MEKTLRQLNPYASIHKATRSGVALDAVLDRGSFDLDRCWISIRASSMPTSMTTITITSAVRTAITIMITTIITTATRRTTTPR